MGWVEKVRRGMNEEGDTMLVKARVTKIGSGESRRRKENNTLAKSKV